MKKNLHLGIFLVVLLVRFDLHRSTSPAKFLCTSHFALFAIHYHKEKTKDVQYIYYKVIQITK